MRPRLFSRIISLFAVLTPLLPATVQAETEASVTGVTPGETVVISDGVAYARAVSPQHLTALVAVKGGKKNVFGDWKLIKGWRVTLTLVAEHGAGSQTFDQFAYENVYAVYERPRRVSKTVRVVIPAEVYGDWALRRCNAELDRRRDAGQRQVNVLRQDIVIGVNVRADMHVDYVVGGDGAEEVAPGSSAGPTAFHANTKIICKAFSAQGPQVSTDLSSERPKVTAAHLTIVEQYGPSGLCKLNLSGKIDGPPSASFNFRYEDGEGHRSDRKTVKMDHTGSALFSHSYNVKNDLHWEEHGKVRIVGDGFASPWATYRMDCVEPGATALQATLPPRLQMRVVPVAREIVDGQLCVSRVKLEAQIRGQGPMSGTAAFVGDGYFSKPQSYSVNTGKTVTVVAFRDLTWQANKVGGFTAKTAGGNGPKSMTIKIGFNVTNQNNAVIASLPRKPFVYNCVKKQGAVGAGAAKGVPVVPPQLKGDTSGTQTPAEKASQAVPLKAN